MIVKALEGFYISGNIILYSVGGMFIIATIFVVVIFFGLMFTIEETKPKRKQKGS